MNFLGHLYFSDNDLELMYANLFGDFVKGSDFKAYPDSLIIGIKLHRKIDDYIDNHPDVLKLLHTLYPSLPKVSSIALDLYFDHLLAKYWDNYSIENLRSFTNKFHNYTPSTERYFTHEFTFLIQKMKKDDWLFNYQFHEGLEFASKGLSRRISFENSLYKAPEVYLKHQNAIESTFNKFMDDAIPYFKRVIDSFNDSL